jgi:hypothetical protein
MRSVKYLENLEIESYELHRLVYTRIMEAKRGSQEEQRLVGIERRVYKRFIRRSESLLKVYKEQQDIWNV